MKLTDFLYQIKIHSSTPRVPNVGATAHRWAMESSRGAVVDQNEFGGAEADHRPLTKINIYPKLQKNISQNISQYHNFF